MKFFLKIISLLIILAVGYLAVENMSQAIDLTIFKGHTYHVSFVYVAFGFVIAGVMAGFTWVLSYSIVKSQKLKEYKRKLEKTSIDAESENSRVTVLESKIKVLEKALDSALGKNNS